MSKYVLIPTLETEPDESIIQLFSLASKSEVKAFAKYIQTDEVVALDLETTGLYPRYHRDQLDEEGRFTPAKIVTYGLHAESIGSIAIDLRESYEGCARDLTDALIEIKPRLIGHNVYFDWMQLANLYGPPSGYQWQDLTWYNDTYVQFKLLATEGWVAQRHGLKIAQTDILGWSLRGDAELDEWLQANGLKKGDMSKAPHEILGRYCALDCQSTFLLYSHFKSIMDKFPAFEVLRPAFISEIRCLIQNYYAGIPVDRTMMQAYIDSLTPQIEQASKELFAIPEVKVFVDRKYKELVAAYPEPKKTTARTLGPEPARLTKTGADSVRWLRWKQKMDNYVEPEPSKTWLRWRKNMDELAAEMEQYGCAKVIFNPGAWQQLKHLVYDVLNLPPVWTKDKTAAKKGIKQDKLDTSKNAYGSWGDVGKALATLSNKEQRKAMSVSWLSNTDPETGLLHPLFKVMGTTTTRLSGSGGVNVQNPVKDKAFLDCLREPDPDNWVWIDWDIVSCESVLMAYRSGDKGYLNLYGPDAKPNDAYIYLMANIPGMKEKVTACGYNPDHPAKEAMGEVKKKYKDDRSVAKQAFLSMQYGSGWKTLFKGLKAKKVTMDGVLITENKARAIYDTYWNTFPGLKKFNEWHEATWERTGGYTINGIGIPVAACSDKVHKLPNHDIQSLGHEWLMVMLMYYEQELDALGLEWYPVLWDMHDQATIRARIINTPEETFSIVNDARDKACKKANALFTEITGGIELQVSGDWGYNFTKFKVEG